MKENIRKLAQRMVLSGLILGLISTGTMAADRVDVNVKVQISGVVSVAVDKTEYDFGSVPAGIHSHSTSAIVVTNDSGTLVEDYQLSASNTANWTLTGTPGAQAADTFVLAARFNTAYAAANFVDANHTLTTSNQTCDGTEFKGDVDCMNVAPGAGVKTRNLWFEIVMPTSSSSTAQQTSRVTVFATTS